MKRLVLYWLLVLSIAAPLCFGQASAINGQIEGTILDPAGASVAGVAVAVTDISTGCPQKGEPNSAGFDRLSVLPLAAYELTAESSGFAPVKRSAIGLTAGST